jgi:hypothetical protein
LQHGKETRTVEADELARLQDCRIQNDLPHLGGPQIRASPVRGSTPLTRYSLVPDHFQIIEADEFEPEGSS